MGVKTKISKKEINRFFKTKSMKKTKNGVSDTVYILNKKYVLKVFENSSEKNIQNEIELLHLCKDLKVARLKNDLFYIKNKPSLIYKRSKGKSLKKAHRFAIKQMGEFLREFHSLTKGKTNTNKKLFEKKSLKKLILKTKKKSFLKEFESIDIKLKKDGIIHGDLFLDNVSFKNGKLSCVYDFSEACTGDFLFDLAVVALTWCESKKDLKLLLKSYGSDLKIKDIKSYIKYVLLYYSVTRYLDKRDYKDLYERFSRLDIC